MGGHGCPRARACRLGWALNADAQLAGVSIPRVIGPARLSQHSCWERVASEALRGRGGGRAGWLIEAIYIYTHPPGAGRAMDVRGVSARGRGGGVPGRQRLRCGTASTRTERRGAMDDGAYLEGLAWVRAGH